MTISFYDTMNHKQRRNRKHQYASAQTTIPSKLIFTLPMINTLKDSLVHFEILLLAGGNRTIPNLELAHLTLDQLKQKLADMLEREEWETVTSFDYNEVWILYTSLAMHIIEIQLRNEKDVAKLPACLALYNQFNAIIEANK